LFSLAHSIGGAVASHYTEAYPNDFDAIALTSSIHRVNIFTFFLNPLMCTAFKYDNRDEIRYALKQKLYDEQEHSF